jgi:Ca-activated chloride channel family protein
MTRNAIRRGYFPAPKVVRTEECVNAFDYNYPKTAAGTFNIHAEGMPSPFGRGLALLKVGIQARIVGREGRKPAHLVFAVDASGSMDRPDRMPLVKEALGLLVSELADRDIVSVVAYGTRALVLAEAVPAARRSDLVSLVDSLACSGSTNLAEGVRAAYAIAHRNFVTNGVNRVILCSDGIANVGAVKAEELLDQVRAYREQGVTFTSAGFGAGAYDDELLERLANSGDGNYVFIDSPEEARRVFVEQLSATLQVVAKDAKIQVEFNPERVRRYRLLGYENRDIADRDFRNDAVDAGEVGSGQSVTALYEIELAEPEDRPRRRVRTLPDVGTVFVRYRNVDTGSVEEISSRVASPAVRERAPAVNEAPRLHLAACVAETAELLRRSEHAAGSKFGDVERVADEVAHALPLDARARELLEVVRRAKGLAGEK